MQKKVSALCSFLCILCLVRYAHAAPPPIVDLRISVTADGTAPFDASTFTPPATNSGTDAGATNGIVRVNDTITYRIETSVNGEDAPNHRFTATVSSDLRWLTLPTECLTAGVSPVSNISSDGLTLTCNTGVRDEGTAIIIFPVAQVRGATPNNTTVTASAIATADGANTTLPLNVTTIATAGALVDLEKSNITGFRADGEFGEPGTVTMWSIRVRALKGSEMLANGNFLLNDIITNTGVGNNARLYTWGSNGSNDACGVVGSTFSSGFTGNNFPFGRIGINAIANATNSVVDSGTITCSQAGGAGSAISVSIAGADVSLFTAPTRYSNGTTTIAGDSYYIASGFVRIWIPDTDVPPAPMNNMVVTNRVDFVTAPLTITAQAANEQSLANNLANYGLTLNGGVGGTYNILAGNDIYTGAPDFVQPGLQYLLDNYAGNSKLTAGSEFLNFTYFDERINNSSQPAKTLIHCNKIDTTTYELTGNFASPIFFSTALFATEFPALQTGLSSSGLICPNPNPSLEPIYAFQSYKNSAEPATVFLADFVVEFATSPNLPSNKLATCEDADGPWSTILPADPSTVTKVRIVADYPARSGEYVLNTIKMPLEMRVKPTVPAGTMIGNFTSNRHNFNFNDGTTYVWEHSTASDDPMNAGFAFDVFHTARGGASNRATIVSAIVRTTKITLPADSITSVSPGDIVPYEIASTLEIPIVSGSPTTTVTITDTLPIGLIYNNDAVVTQGDVTGMTTMISGGGMMPTVVTWVFPNIASDGSAMPVIQYTATVSPTVTRASFTNTVVIDTPLDTTSDINLRTATKTVQATEVGNFHIRKSVPFENREPNQQIFFDLNFSNRGPLPLTVQDYIDVLPYNNNNLVPNTLFNGTATFSDFTTLTGSERFLVTNATQSTINYDPCDISNIPTGQTAPFLGCSMLFGGAAGTGTFTGVGATGGTTWCEVTGNPVANDATYAVLPAGCPQSRSEITAIRIISTNGLAVGASERSFQLTMDTFGNQEGDIYTNEFSGRAFEIDLPVISNDVNVTVVLGSIGDFIWNDIDNDGIQDLGEPGIQGVTVELYDSMNILISTDITDSNGGYLFSNLVAGQYEVRVIPPPSYTIVSPSQGTDTSLDSNFDQGTGRSGQIILNIGEDRVDIDGGLNAPGGIGNQVYHDVNNNGIFDVGDIGLSNVEVTLYRDNNDNGVVDSGDTVERIITTDSNGIYNFLSLQIDDGSGSINYIVAVTDTTGILSSFTNVLGTGLGDNIGKNPSGYSSVLSLGTNADQTADFGYRRSHPECPASFCSGSCTGASLTAVQLGIDSSLFALQKNFSKVISLRTAYGTSAACTKLTQGKKSELISQVSSLYQEGWQTIWAELQSFNATGCETQSICTTINLATVKADLLSKTRAIFGLAKKTISVSCSNRATAQLRRRRASLLGHYQKLRKQANSLINSYPTTVNYCY